MVEKKKEEQINDALMKVALGYQVAEVTEEYAEIGGELKLTKRKKTKKDIPPDLKAVQMLLATGEETEYGTWTDEQLEVEKKRLLEELKKQKSTKEEGIKNGVERRKVEGRSASKPKKTTTRTKRKLKKGDSENEG